MKQLTTLLLLLLIFFLGACRETSKNAIEENLQKDEVNKRVVIIVPLEIGDEVVTEAKKYLHVSETEGKNRSPEIDRFHDYAGLPYGNPWCLMYVNYVYGSVLSRYGLEPYTKTARVSFLYKFALKNKFLYKIKFAKSVAYGIDKLESGDIIIWLNNYSGNILDNDGNPTGHAGIVIQQIDKKTLNSIEGNTSSDDTGSQREGDGVFLKKRIIHFDRKFRIEAFLKPLYTIEKEVENE